MELVPQDRPLHLQLRPDDLDWVDEERKRAAAAKARIEERTGCFTHDAFSFTSLPHLLALRQITYCTILEWCSVL